MKVETLTAGTVDFDELARLQRKSFEGVADPDQLEGVQTPEYYRWKYTLAGGEARIAQIRTDNGELVAMNSAFPLTLTLGDSTTRGWQSCDTATHPSARGKGYFLKCLSALKETFTDGEVFFGYPNSNSTRGFTKFGWQKISTLQLFAGIIPPLPMPPKIRRIDRFGPDQDDLATRLAQSGRIMIQRSAAYMNDRYCSPQRPLYTSFIYEDAGKFSRFRHGTNACDLRHALMPRRGLPGHHSQDRAPTSWCDRSVGPSGTTLPGSHDE